VNYIKLLFFLIIISGVTACKTYKQSFKKKDISIQMTDARSHAESKFTTYDASNLTIGNLEWKGSSWDKKYEYGKDPMFRYSFPWDQEEFSQENIHLTDSCIEIWAKTDGTEGVLFSNFKIKYGIVKALVKLPNVEGAWSAFWLFRGMPELDIFEHCGQWKNQVSVTHHWGYSYEKGMKKSTLNNERYNKSFKPTEQYYVYEVEVTPYEVIYRINGEVTRIMTEGIPSHEQHIILNVSTGDYCGDIPLKKDAVMKVKWIKVFEMP
jgi:beta-glucanase (GH16 family)